MRAGLYLAILVTGLACAGTAAAKSGVPPLLFPVVGQVTYTDDFGQARPGGLHQGNDLLGTKRAPVVAVEEGTVKFWTTSAAAGCIAAGAIAGGQAGGILGRRLPVSVLRLLIIVVGLVVAILLLV